MLSHLTLIFYGSAKPQWNFSHFTTGFRKTDAILSFYILIKNVEIQGSTQSSSFQPILENKKIFIILFSWAWNFSRHILSLYCTMYYISFRLVEFDSRKPWQHIFTLTSICVELIWKTQRTMKNILYHLFNTSRFGSFQKKVVKE